MRDAGVLHLTAIRGVPVVVLHERLLVGLRRLPPEQALGLRDVHERIARRRLVVPLDERRKLRELEPAEDDLRGTRRNRAQLRGRPRVGDQSLEVGAHGAELRCSDVEHLAGHVRRRRTQDRVDEVIDCEELVPVVPAAEHRNALALADPVEQDLEHAEPLRADERLRADDHRLEAGAAHELLRADLRLAVRTDADERRRPRRSGAPSGRRIPTSTR